MGNFYTKKAREMGAKLEWKNWIMEFIGTFALCYVGGMSTGLVVNVALAHGFALGFLIYAGGHVSGAHYNPAVTIGLCVTGHCNWLAGIFYMLFQYLGGFCAGMMCQWMKGSPSCPGGVIAEYGAFQGALMEFWATFFLAFTVMGTAVDTRAAHGVYGMCIGGSLTMSVLGIGGITGAALNPTRYFGPALGGLLVGDGWPAGSHAWVYLFPFLGGLVACCLYNWCFLEKPKVERVVEVEVELKI